MNRQVYEVGVCERSAWTELWSQMPDRTVFHSLPWLETIEEAMGLRLVLAKVEKNGRCAGIWPSLEQRKGPLRVLGSPLPGWSTPYMGPLIAEGEEAQGVAEAVLSSDLIGKPSYFELRALDRRTHLDLTPFGFERLRRFETALLTLESDEQAMWDRLAGNCRTKVRKATKANVEVREDYSLDFLEDFWQMSLETFGKSGRLPGYDLEFVRILWGRLRPHAMVRAYSAWLGQQRIAVAIRLYDDRTVYAWNGVSTLEGRKLAPNNLIEWHVIRDAITEGLSEHDFVSISGSAGTFKKSFGHEAVGIATHWSRSYSMFAAMLKVVYEKYLRLRRRN